MSKAAHGTGTNSHERGTMSSYVIGFILSLLCTFVPYYLVENQTVAGNTLLGTILGFALLQMVIQVVFFLHLGRGPKPNWNFFFFISTIGLILVVVGGSILIIHNLHYNMSVADQTKKLVGDEAIYQVNGTKTGACEGQHTNHRVTIKNGKVTPLHTRASQCDTLTFMNDDVRTREIAFGKYPEHDVYAGQIQLTVRSGMGKTITLSESGTFLFHDHLQAETAGDFTVTP